MDAIITKLDSIYQNKLFKSLFILGMSIITIVFMVLIPLFKYKLITPKPNWFLLFSMGITAISLCCTYFYIADLDKMYYRFYKGAVTEHNRKADGIAIIIHTGEAAFYAYFIFTTFFNTMKLVFPDFIVGAYALGFLVGGISFLVIFSQARKKQLLV